MKNTIDMINNEFETFDDFIASGNSENYKKKYGVGTVFFIEKKRFVLWFNYDKFMLYIYKNKIRIIHFKKDDQFPSYVCFLGLIIN